MDWDATAFIVLIIALSTGGWLINNWIRAKHGYDLEDEWGGKTARADRSARGAGSGGGARAHASRARP